jgi:hypothetical protein
MIKCLFKHIDKKLNHNHNIMIGCPKDIPIVSPDCGWNHGGTEGKGGE